MEENTISLDMTYVDSLGQSTHFCKVEDCFDEDKDEELETLLKHIKSFLICVGFSYLEDYELVQMPKEMIRKIVKE